MRQYKRKTLINIVAAVIILFLCGCSASHEKEQEMKKKKETVKIGVILPFSGPQGYLAEEEKEAIELAVREINSKNSGAIIQTVYADSKDNPSEAAIIADNLLKGDSVSAFFTSPTPISQGVLPLATKNKKLIAMLCTDPKIQTMSPYAFRLYQNMADEADQLLEFYRETGKGKKIVILYLNHSDIIDEVSHYLIPGFMQKGINVVYYEPYELKEKEFQSKIDRLKHSGANSVIILGFGPEYLPILQELSHQKLLGKIEVAGGWGFLAANTLPAALTEGIIVASPQYVFQKNEKAKAFEENFVQVYGHAPIFDAASAYDAMNIFAEGLIQGLVEKHGNADTVSFIITNHKYSGITGDISVDNEGGLSVPMGLGIIKKGRIVPYNKQ